MVFAIRKLKIFLNFSKFFFLPGVWKVVITHYKAKNLNHRTGVLNSLNEASCRTDYNAKNLNSF